MKTTPKEELYKRIGAFQKKIAEAGLDGAFIQQSSDLFYYSGVYQDGILYIPVEGESLYLIKRSLRRTKELSALTNIVPYKYVGEISTILQERGYFCPKNIGLEMDCLTVQWFWNWQKLFKEASFKDCSYLVREQKMVKSPYEIGLIREASAKTDKFFKILPSLIEIGKKEFELGAELERESRYLGHQGLLRIRGLNSDFTYGCILAGESGDVGSFFDSPLGGVGLNPSFPFGAGEKKIERNEPIMVDYGGAFEGYCVDMTRVYKFGELSSLLMKAHKTALLIQDTLACLAKEGVDSLFLYEKARELAKKEGLLDYFMGYKEQAHFVGHGLGIELNEWPVLAKKQNRILESNMVIALEPKFIFPKVGAVGIENTFIVGKNGLEKLSTLDDEIFSL